MSSSYLNLASSPVIANPSYAHKPSLHTLQGVPIKKTSWVQVWHMLLGKAGRFFSGKTEVHRDYYYEQCYFCIVLVPTTNTSRFCKVGCEPNQKGGFLPKPARSLADWSGQRRERSSSYCSEGAPAQQQLITVKSYAGIIPPAGLWRQMQCFISQEREGWQVRATQAFHFTDFGFSSSSQALALPPISPHRLLQQRARGSWERYPLLPAPGSSPPAPQPPPSCHGLLLLPPKLNPRRPNPAKCSGWPSPTLLRGYSAPSCGFFNTTLRFRSNQGHPKC